MPSFARIRFYDHFKKFGYAHGKADVFVGREAAALGLWPNDRISFEWKPGLKGGSAENVQLVERAPRQRGRVHRRIGTRVYISLDNGKTVHASENVLIDEGVSDLKPGDVVEVYVGDSRVERIAKL